MKGILTSLRHGVKDERGQALVISGLAILTLFSFAGLAIDVGQLRFAQRKLQSEADAAAIAGALELSYCGGTNDCTAMQTAAQQALVENGVTSSTLLTQCASGSGSNVTITVNNGPCAMGSTASDPNYGNASYVEVVVSKQKLTYFLRIFGITSVNLSARAEATKGNSPYCLYVSTSNTSTSAANALLMNGGAQLNLGCGVMDDSGSSQALLANGNVSLTASAISVHGGVLNNGNNTLSPTPATGVAALSDPLSWLNSNVPASGSCTYSSAYVINGNTTTLSPGNYCGGLIINGSSTVTFNPGTYIMGGSMIINGGDSVSGSNVMFYFSSGSLTMNGSSHANWVAPTTGTYAGILFFQNSGDSSGMILNGDSTSVFQGTLYLPGANLTINGGGNLAAYTILDASSITDNGTAVFKLGADYSSLSGGSPAKAVTAVLAQ